jgi:hypothetical protein
VFQKFDKTTITVLCVLALMALLLIGLMIRIVDRSSEHVNEIKQTRVVEPTRLAPSLSGDDDLVNLIINNNPRYPSCIVSDGKLTPAILHKILAVKNLHEVWLKRCEFTAADLQALSVCPLEVIKIEEGNISEDCMQIISKMPKLRKLEIFASDVPPHAMAHLAESKISWLMIHYCLSSKNGGQLTASDLSILCDMENLMCLDLERDRFAPGALKGLARSNISVLNVERCNLTDNDVVDIAKIPKITCVNLNRNDSVSCRGLKTLLACKNFKTAAFDGDTSNCDLSDDDRKRFGPKLYRVPAYVWISLKSAN